MVVKILENFRNWEIVHLGFLTFDNGLCYRNKKRNTGFRI